jgi:hypothetical protein
MIEIFENLRKGGHGFRLTDDLDQRVIQGAVRRHPNPGLYEDVEELDYAAIAEAEEYLTAQDYRSLVALVKAALKQETEKAEAKADALKAAKAAREHIEEEDEEFLSNPPFMGDRRIKKTNVVRLDGQWFIGFFKKGGYREHLAPCTLKTLRAVLRGEQSLRYYKNSNRFIIN